ncbi:hypothetical protein N7457_009782 [Penicillium paradoxum]|uniref:uncharacterized protein n=1 Tax=Penicillium paradoxum TaxID=176176 RepID=UPI0025478A08|nr:uncharacterized protein N7457_009782 [Penicillium paradoxum]KAJ5774886.1 hypothetical protein N7457_009782 [Penicillium paradoxum]
MRQLSDPHKTLVPLADTKGPSARILELLPTDTGWFHRTLSLCYAVILSGTVGFIADGDKEKISNQHDVIICRGANHEWVKRGKDVAMVFVMTVPTQEIVTEGGKKDWGSHLREPSMTPRKRNTPYRRKLGTKTPPNLVWNSCFCGI